MEALYNLQPVCLNEPEVDSVNDQYQYLLSLFAWAFGAVGAVNIMDAYSMVPIFVALVSSGLAVFMFTSRPTPPACSKCDKCSSVEYSRPKRSVKKRVLCTLECCADQPEYSRRHSISKQSSESVQSDTKVN